MYDNNIQRTNTGVIAEGLGKRYDDLWAVRDVDLDVAPGTVLGLLGHNGAGKTTTIRMLTTLAQPTEGRAAVNGLDVVSDAAAVRASIGLAGQYATVDGLMTARANLEMVGRLYHLPRATVKERLAELLERLGLSDRGDDLVKTFSGGMRRRLDLAASLMASPPVLFLDEPTTGLDPRSRNELWGLLREFVRNGAALVLTTQYLDEADRLADQIVVLDRGRIAAAGTPAELKQHVGGERIVVTVENSDHLDIAARALEPYADGSPALEPDGPQVIVPVRAGTRLTEAVRALDAAGADAVDVSRREATLDDVFLSLTDPLRRKEATAA